MLYGPTNRCVYPPLVLNVLLVLERRCAFLRAAGGRRCSARRISVLRCSVYAVYAISSLDTDPSLRHRTQNMLAFVGTQQGVRARAPGPACF